LPGRENAAIFPGMFKVNIIARNFKDESLVVPPVEVMVESGCF
jgi:hypothetical protein